MERIANTSLRVLILIYNSTWIDFLANPKAGMLSCAFGGRHTNLGSLARIVLKPGSDIKHLLEYPSGLFSDSENRI